MTGEGTGEQGVPEPLSADTVADLRAGVLDKHTSARLWPRVEADPEARAMLAALDATSAELAGIATGPAEPIPADVAGRVDTALAHERQPAPETPAPVVPLGAGGRRRNRVLAWGVGIATTVAAATVAIAVIGPGQVERPPSMALPAPHDAVPALHSGNLGEAVGAVLGEHRLGRLESDARLDACLAASGVDPGIQPAGVRPATIDGQRAVVVLLPTGEDAQYRLVALSPACGPDNSALVEDTVIAG